MQPLIRLQGVTKTFGDGATRVTALKCADLEVMPGEVLMLVGPSGSGKTTLLSIMGAILKATSGSVQINGREIRALNESELPQVRLDNIGFVSHGFNLFPSLTALDNVALAPKLKGIPGRQSRKLAEPILERVGLKISAIPILPA